MAGARGLSLLAAALLGCQAGSEPPPAADEFCRALAETGCEWGDRCKGESQPRAQCIEGLLDVWDGCQPAVDAIELGEVRYHEDAASALFDEILATPCSERTVSPDARGVLEGLLAAGETCHSDFSCQGTLRCEDFSLAEPEGVCAADPLLGAAEAPAPEDGACELGEDRACPCPIGGYASQSCTPMGVFSPCSCPTPAM